MTVTATAQLADGAGTSAPIFPSGKSCSVLGMRVDELNYDCVLNEVRHWTQEATSRYICVSNVHMVMETYDSQAFREIVNAADMVCPDGMPVVWACRKLGLRDQTRVVGPELTLRICAMSAASGIKVGFYGSTPEVMDLLVGNLRERYPTLDIAYRYSPPFRPLTSEEDDEVIRAINQSGAQILFVGLGCPKQENWMHQHRGKIAVTMLGVGWAFEIGAGLSRSAPLWMQQSGLEWLHRLMSNPRRVWWRYLKHNPRYLGLIFLEIVGQGRTLISHRT